MVQNLPRLYLTTSAVRIRAAAILTAAGELPPATSITVADSLDAVCAGLLRAAGCDDEVAVVFLSTLWRPAHPLGDDRPRVSPREREGTYLRELGERVRVVRRARRMTVSGLSRRAGLTLTALHEVETGQANPSTLTLVRLAASLGVPVPLLVDDKVTPLRVLRLLRDLPAGEG